MKFIFSYGTQILHLLVLFCFFTLSAVAIMFTVSSDFYFYLSFCIYPCGHIILFLGGLSQFLKNSNISSLFLGVHLICMFSIKLSGKTSVPLFECTYCFWNCLALLSYCSILLEVAGILYFNSSMTSAITLQSGLSYFFSFAFIFSFFPLLLL